ncbi:MAG: bifunctional phosphoribosyl-AMP cyclohydrolase/phosphoribosyl-ATP diphosphatase HisIE [Pedobacter sp.]|nr:MAG: bifunctional phosphoribosyl-AMP cyclohydrolase/phosphoribosyl-ATP diphosphatase HisIE [Pedobacter sp.]
MIDFKKGEGLVPVIIQDYNNLSVLMLGYMNEEAYQRTLDEKKVCFYSRSKQRLWTKGETSGNFLWVQDIKIDCDADTILIFVKAQGPTCHTGTMSCFNTPERSNFLAELETIIAQRWESEQAQSYVASLKAKGLTKIAQKVGEEGVETVIAALAESDEHFINESADLLFHLMVLIKAKGLSFNDITACLANRHSKN